jgi:hypothetical protein
MTRPALVAVAPGTDPRAAIVASSLWASGLRASLPEDRPTFQALIGPEWDLSVPFKVSRRADGGYDTQGVSTCALVASGIVGHVVRWPWEGYPFGRGPGKAGKLDAMSRINQAGIEAHAMRPRGQTPEPGDIVCIGSGLGTHALTVTQFSGDTMESIDGGQVDDAQHGFLQTIAPRSRKWSAQTVNWVVDSAACAKAYPRETWLMPAGSSAGGAGGGSSSPWVLAGMLSLASAAGYYLVRKLRKRP